MKKLLIFIIASMILILIGCQEKSANDTLSVYLVKSIDNDNEQTIKKQRLLFTDKDIKEYNWESHVIVFTDEFIEKQRNIGFISEYDSVNDKTDEKSLPFVEGGCNILGTSQSDKFAVFVNDETIYTGSFEQYLFSSFMPIGAVIKDIKNGIAIDFNNDKEDDLRSDNRIKKVLKSKDLLI